MVKSTDVFVVGGGPAGLAVAIAARQRGCDVVVADGAEPPIDKPCGEGLMPDGRSALARLGVAIPRQNSYPFRGIRFLSGEMTAEAGFPNGFGIGVRRTVLHSIMSQRARDLGVTLLWKTPVSGLHAKGVQVGNQAVPSRWVVGADGGHSLVRRWSGLDRLNSNRIRFAFRRHYRVPPWTQCMELYWGSGCQIYVTPIAADEVCVALISGNQHLRLDAALAEFPRLAVRLEAAIPTSAERGAISATRKLKHVYNNHVVLVGDASGGVDAITGEGLCLSFNQAQVLADCFAAGDLRPYQQMHSRLLRRPALMGRLMLTLDWKTSFRQRVMRAFRSDPRLFARMLAMHVGSLSLVDSATTGFSLGWKLLNA